MAKELCCFYSSAEPNVMRVGEVSTPPQGSILPAVLHFGNIRIQAWLFTMYTVVLIPAVVTIAMHFYCGFICIFIDSRQMLISYIFMVYVLYYTVLLLLHSMCMYFFIIYTVSVLQVLQLYRYRFVLVLQSAQGTLAHSRYVEPCNVSLYTRHLQPVTANTVYSNP